MISKALGLSQLFGEVNGLCDIAVGREKGAADKIEKLFPANIERRANHDIKGDIHRACGPMREEGLANILCNKGVATRIAKVWFFAGAMVGKQSTANRAL